jgi:multidrug efflux pump subunit AcrB
MMWIVRLALRRPYSIGVMAFFILIMGILSIKSMIVDIFPVIDIPVVTMIWSYPGLSAEEMEKRVVLLSERGTSTSVAGVDHIESQSLPGIGVIKVYFQKGTDIGSAIAQMSATASTSLRSMPPGMTPPVILQFNASNVQVAQLTLKSKNLGEDKIYDYAFNFIRIRLFTIPGLATPAPFGGKQRMIMIDVDSKALAAKGLSPNDVLNALQASNIILPAGTTRMGSREYNIALNSSPEQVPQFNDIPIKVINGQTVTIGDVGKASDSYADQYNVVRVDRGRAAYLSILKKADASTLAVVEAAKDMIPIIKETAPKGLEMDLDFDQSVFVRNAIGSVLHEGVIASILVSLMILIFLGNWRSVIIVCTSIPLSILVSVVFLKITGNSLNIMTLGGLSLAIGMLVDDATVEVENIHRNQGLGKPLTVAILDGASQIATPALVATLSICIVFFPVALLSGPAQYLFSPMAIAVVFAMLASYLLSRTLVPTTYKMFMEADTSHNPHLHAEEVKQGDWLKRAGYRFNMARDKGFDRLRQTYGRFLGSMLDHKPIILFIALLILVISSVLFKVVGTDFFPSTDVGIMKLHFRAPSGTRIEETEKLVDRAEASIQRIIPGDELSTVNDMIGVPTSFNLAFVNTDNSSSMDADIQVALKVKHRPTIGYMKKIRAVLNDSFPGCQAYFQSADIVSQVLNFGLSAPIDVEIQFENYDTAFRYARLLRDEFREIAGIQDVNVKQVLDYPTFNIDVDRVRAAQSNLSQRDVANDMLIALSSSSTVSPAFYLNPQNNVSYSVAVKVPIATLNSVARLLSTPLTPGNNTSTIASTETDQPTDLPMAQAQTLGNISTVKTENRYNLISHYTVQRVMDVNANVEGRDLGSVSTMILKRIAALGKLPPGMRIDLLGQYQIMHKSFRTLALGLILAIALVYLLMVVLFQSWLDPFIIMIAVPGAFTGILWMLALTGTTINVVSLMGSIVAVGIAVSNSVLLVSFANEIRVDNPAMTSFEAALEAGKTRLRPVMMTAMAMILGMIPMSLGLGSGGEQNAPLARAVIGGLLMATLSTLFIVPVVYSILRRNAPSAHTLDEEFERESQARHKAHQNDVWQDDAEQGSPEADTANRNN